MKVKNLLVSVILLFFCCTMPVSAEEEQTNEESNVESGVVENDESSDPTTDITVELEKVSSVKAVAVSHKRITLSWQSVLEADGYEIYRSTKKGVKGRLLVTITSGDTTKYHDDTVQIGNLYYYTITAYKDLETERIYGEDSKQISQRARLKAVTGVSAKRKSYNTIVLSWKKNSQADGYRIYRSESIEGTYSVIATLKGKNLLAYNTKVPVCGKNYYYKIAAYKVVNGEKHRGNYSEIVCQNTRPAKIQFTNASISKHESVSLFWKKSSGAKGYMIYRSTKENGTYSRVKTIAKASTLKWTNTNLNEGTVYFYKIRPYTEVNGKKVYGQYSKAFEKKIIKEELKKVEKYTYVNYVSGGTTTKGWDCSGFTQWVYKNIFGVSIPRTSREQAYIGKSINKYDMSKWKAGDILVYASGGSVNHVGLYLGNGKMMHALNSKYDTVIQDVDYYESWDSKNNLKSVRRCL